MFSRKSKIIKEKPVIDLTPTKVIVITDESFLINPETTSKTSKTSKEKKEATPKRIGN